MANQISELSEDERIVCQTRLHWVLLLAPALLIILGGLWIPAKGFSALVLVAIGLAWGILSYRKYFNSYMYVTNKKVVISTSAFLRRPYKILLTDIVHADFYQPSLGAILNFGKITIVHGGKYKSVFRMVSSPADFVTAVREQATVARQNP